MTQFLACSADAVAKGSSLRVEIEGVDIAVVHAEDDNFFTSALISGTLTAPSGSNGVYSYGGNNTAGVFPTSTFASANYYADVVFSSANNRPPTAVATAGVPHATASSGDIPPPSASDGSSGCSTMRRPKPCA